MLYDEYGRRRGTSLMFWAYRACRLFNNWIKTPADFYLLGDEERDRLLCYMAIEDAIEVDKTQLMMQVMAGAKIAH